MLADEADSKGPDDTEGGVQLASSASNLLDQYRVDKDLRVLDGAIRLLTELIEGARTPNHGALLVDLARSLRWRFEATGEMRALEKAHQVGHAALEEVVDPKLRARGLNTVAGIERHLFEVRGDVSHLDIALRLLSEASDLEGDPARLIGLDANLSSLLRLRFALSGESRFLDQAVVAVRRSLNRSLEQDPLVAYNASAVFAARYEANQQLQDLNEAIDLAYACLDHISETRSDWPAYGAHLAQLLSMRLERNGREDDQNQALILYEKIEQRELPDTVRSVVLGNHVSLLLHLFEVRQEPRFLDTVLTLAEEAARTAEVGIPNLHWALLQVSKAALSRYQELHEADLLQRSIIAAEKALDLAPDNHPDLAGIRTQLAVALVQESSSPGNRARARNLHLAAVAQESAPLGDRINSAEILGRDAAQNSEWGEARQAYSAAIALLPRLAWRGTDRNTQEYRLLSAQGLAIDGAAMTLSDGDASDALGLLEEGRALIWRGSLEIWADLATLSVQAPDLAARLEYVRAAIDEGAVTSQAGSRDDT